MSDHHYVNGVRIDEEQIETISSIDIYVDSAGKKEWED